MSDCAVNVRISIHAPRKGSDIVGFHYAIERILFQSTPPARGATIISGNASTKAVFQSTPPARGATSAKQVFTYLYDYFNPRPPQGERRHLAKYQCGMDDISIHAPRKGSDWLACNYSLRL